MWLQKPPLGTQIDWSHPLTKGLVAFWLFNEGGGDKAYDLSGNANTGTLTNMSFPPTTTSGRNPGKFGSALAFDGSNDFVDAGAKPSLDITDAITIEALVYMDPDATGNDNTISGFVTKNDGAGANLGYYIAFLDRDAQSEIKQIRWEGFYGSGDSFQVNKQNAIPIAGWYHITGTYDKDLGGTEEAKLYINGVKVASADYSKAIGINAFSVKIGALHKLLAPYYQFHLNGTIDLVRIWARALSAAEIQLLYMYPFCMFEFEE